MERMETQPEFMIRILEFKSTRSRALALAVALQETTIIAVKLKGLLGALIAQKLFQHTDGAMKASTTGTPTSMKTTTATTRPTKAMVWSMLSQAKAPNGTIQITTVMGITLNLLSSLTLV